MISRIQTKLWVSFSLISTVLALSACSTPSTTSSTGQPSVASTAGIGVSTPTIDLDGSSTVYPISEAIAQEFRQAQPQVGVEAEFSGTGGGFEKFCVGETDINNASRPISTEELADCNQAGVRFIELPIAFDALTIVVNPQNTWAQDLTVAELKKIWEPAAQGKITNWQQIRPSFPNRPLKLYGAGTDSGTYDYFAEVIAGGKGTRTDYTASEDDDELVEGVSSDPNALGYFGLSYYQQNQDRLKALAVDGGSGAIVPSRETIVAAKYQPLSRPLFLYVNLQAAQNNPNLRDFVEFYLKNAERVVNEVGYAALPKEAYDIAKVHLYNGKVGTSYEGKSQPNLTITEVLRKEKSF